MLSSPLRIAADIHFAAGLLVIHLTSTQSPTSPAGALCFASDWNGHVIFTIINRYRGQVQPPISGFKSPSGNVVHFDVQSAEPGTFTVPGVIELENYEPGSMLESPWIYFKGNPQAGPQPGHPFERPFNDSAQLSVDIVGDDDTSKVFREIMRPSPPSPRRIVAQVYL